ncbi:MAG: uroporphyrinogen decarboxylase family protein [bacterium]
MTQREQYRAFCRREPGVCPPNMDNGPLMSAYERWLSEGLNPTLDPRRFDEWCDVFGLDRYYCCVNVGVSKPPLFLEEILEETETIVTKRQTDGSVIRDNKGWHKSIPQELRPAVTCRAEWERLRDWLDVDGPLPSSDDPAVVSVLERARTAEVPVRLSAGSILGTPRNWLGFEAFAMLPYDDPAWFEEMLETQCRFAEAQIRYFGEQGVQLDCVHFWEDICFKNGPIVSPTIFREFALPRYRRIVELARSYSYTQVSVDSDGNIEALLPLWLEAGVNLFWPLEVQAGMDINSLQERYYGQTCWLGGIHKHRLTGGDGAIAAELARVRPAMERGGYIPTLDHCCPSDVSFENYLTYLRLRHDILGLGRGGPDHAVVCR